MATHEVAYTSVPQSPVVVQRLEKDVAVEHQIPCADSNTECILLTSSIWLTMEDYDTKGINLLLNTQSHCWFLEDFCDH